MQKWATKPGPIILVATFLTFLVAFESLYFIPWAPYFLIYAILAVIIPIYLKMYRFGKLRDLASTEIAKLFVAFLIVSFVILFLMDLIYIVTLQSLGLINNPIYDLSAALYILADEAALKFGITINSAIALYGAYVVIWAPIGEELFYRGYMYKGLRERYSITISALISSFFFGIRHMTHFLFILPDYPVFSGLYWAFHAFIFGLLMAYAYEKTDTLYVPMLIHFLINLISVLIG